MSRSLIIDHFQPDAVMRGLLDGEGFRNRVPGTTVFTCPRCAHRIRFRWRSFYQADGRSLLHRKLRHVFDDLTPELRTETQSFIDFHCPTCQAPTRIIFSIHDSGNISLHFDIYAVLVGEGKSRR